MSQLECRNVESLIGWCIDQGETLLVYDYIFNGSLDKHLVGNRLHLSWNLRYNVVPGLASALLYLHEESGQCILHPDVKSANVMLDLNFNAKLGDFGAARFLDPRFSSQTIKVVGTFGYIAPEYYHEGRGQVQNQTFIALELWLWKLLVGETYPKKIACGRRKHKDEECHLGLVTWVWELYGGGNILDAAVERLNMDFNAQEVEGLLIVGGLWCAHPIKHGKA